MYVRVLSICNPSHPIGIVYVAYQENVEDYTQTHRVSDGPETLIETKSAFKTQFFFQANGAFRVLVKQIAYPFFSNLGLTSGFWLFVLPGSVQLATQT